MERAKSLDSGGDGDDVFVATPNHARRFLPRRYMLYRQGRLARCAGEGGEWCDNSHRNY